MKYIIDRFEDQFAVLESEDLTFILVNRKNISGDVKEGDCLRYDGFRYILDKETTDKKRNHAYSLFTELKSKNKI